MSHGESSEDDADLGPDGTPLGDTAEAHDEVNPHDLPLDHPGREAAAEQADGAEGTTRGGGESDDG